MDEIRADMARWEYGWYVRGLPQPDDIALVRWIRGVDLVHARLCICSPMNLEAIRQNDGCLVSIGLCCRQLAIYGIRIRNTGAVRHIKVGGHCAAVTRFFTVAGSSFRLGTVYSVQTNSGNKKTNICM